MERELKIIFTVFLTFLIFGFTSLFQSGSFVTPVFFIKPILFLLAIIFFLLNLKSHDKWILGMYVLAIGAYLLTDAFVLSFIHEKVSVRWAQHLESEFVSVLTLFAFFGFLFLAAYYFFKMKRNNWVTGFLFVTLAACFVLVIFTPYFILQEILIKLYLLVYFIFGQSEFNLKDKSLRVLSYQFGAIVFLESFEYFN